MYQTVGHEGIEKLAEAMGLPLYRQTTRGCAKQTSRSYRPEEGDEVEDLFVLLSTVQVKTTKYINISPL
jgi:diphthine-ammonia ligase